jgi:hypothetical protein
MLRLASCLVALVGLTILGGPAAAVPIQFSGPYSPSLWGVDASCGSADFSAAPGSISIYSGMCPATVTIEAVQDGTVSFDYVFVNEYHSGFWVVENGDPVFVTGATSSGSYSFAVTAGERFGFELDNHDFSWPTLTISNFDAPTNTPEPASVALLTVGGLTFGWIRRRRR